MDAEFEKLLNDSRVLCERSRELLSSSMEVLAFVRETQAVSSDLVALKPGKETSKSR